MPLSHPLRLALIGNPNCGKTALFNLLTGARHKVANYAGVTVERKEGQFVSGGRTYDILDLPGAYSLNALTPDEAITRDVLLGLRADEKPIDLIVMVADANNLRLNLRLVLEVKSLGRPMVLALNMMDVARQRGLVIDIERLSAELGIPVVDVVAIAPGGANALIDVLNRTPWNETVNQTPVDADLVARDSVATLQARQADVRRIVAAVIREPGKAHRASDAIDAVVLHPVFGYVLLSVVLFLIFQAVFSWSKLPMDWIKDGVDGIGAGLRDIMPDTILRSLLVDGILSGTGSVLVFLPQILILFLFILSLEDSGYLPRAAFLLDRLMGRVGLSGRAFIPLLSSFACAIPGIMATRTIQNPRERLATIMIAPLMTCSARLPVYALIIAAFIPDRSIGIFNLQGLVLFALYVAGIISAMAVAFVFKRAFSERRHQPLMMELPNYHWPNLRNLIIGLWERTRIFVMRVGTIILSLMILLWFLSTFPAPPEGATGAAIQYSFAGRLGHWLQYVFAPIGFNWQISIALVPGLAAREVAVGALGTVYALSGTGEELSSALTPVIAATWGLPTALSLLAWYVFAPQCLSTLSIVRRETNSWKPVFVMAGYMFALAYGASFATYQVSKLLLGGG
jgi:ferrous iron transport protein B